MKERPILFSGPMVRAILDGRKTQARRVAKVFENRPDLETILRRFPNQVGCPYGEPGDRLWVRETWRTRREWDRIAPSKLPVTEDSSFTALTLREQYITYAESDTQANKLRGKLRPSNHMPRWASRITLEIVGVRVERLQDISGADATAEGTSLLACYGPGCPDGAEGCNARGCYGAREWYREMWEQINGPDSWQANPWVWVVQFRRVEQ